IAGGFAAQIHDWGGFSNAFHDCFADGNIVINRNGATELRVGGFVGFTQQSGAYYNNQTVCKITANGAEGYTGFFGGFAGDNSNVGYTENRYLGNTYTGSTYPKVGASSGTPSAQITDQMIRLAASPITISKLMLDPPEGAWVSGSAGVGLQANITKTAAVAGALEVFVSANSAATTGTNIPAPTGIFAPNTYKLPAASGLLETGKLYLIAQEAGNTANRVVQEFNIIRDIYSPRLSGLLATKTAGGGFDVTLNATDSQSGVKAVFASTSPTAPPIGGRVNLTKGSDAANSWSGKLSAPTAGSAWYIYAVDNVGNMSAAGLAVEQAARRIGIYSYDDMKKIGVDKAYPLSGDYIQMNDFAIPDGTAHTPIGSNGAPFTGTYDGGSFTITGGKNMTWNDSARGDWGPVYGLFGDFCGTMRNLNVKDITMTKSGDSVAIAQYGILAGATHGATISDVTISNCAIDIDVAVTNELQVGAIGETYSSSLERVNVNNISIKVNAGCPVYAGGLMGVVEGGNVKDCLVTNPIITVKSIKNVGVGGFVGACAYL
ncbi:MAG: hypothetical protein RRY08_06095, partial [Christensenella sp.]